MPTTTRLPRLKRLLRQVLTTSALTLAAIVVTVNCSPFLTPVFPTPPSPATLPPEIQKVLNGRHRIVTLGDSITEAGKLPNGYVWLLQRYLETLYPTQKIEIVNAGISGHKATDMQARFQRDVIDKKPDLVTINVGVNDVWHAFFNFKTSEMNPQGDLAAGVPLGIYREKLVQMVQAAQAAGIRPVLLSPTPIREVLDGPENRRLALYVATMREVARQNNCLFIDLNASFRDVIFSYQRHAGRTSNLLTTDGVHPNPAGNRVIAFTILRGLGISPKAIENLEVRKR